MLGEGAGCLRDDVLHQAGEAAAVSDNEHAQFRPQRMVRQDAEIAADVGEDGADWPVADQRVEPGGMLSRDLLRRGQVG
jgi:hypothetical protein